MEFITAVGAFIKTAAPFVQVAGGVLGVVSAFSSAGAKVHQGESRAFEYEAKAEQTMAVSETDKLKARQDATAYREAGTASLRRMRTAIAATKAKAAAGSLNPLSGSTGALIDYSFAEGVDDYFYMTGNAISALENVNVVEGAARYQRDIYRQAAVNARRGGYYGAVTDIATKGFQAFESGAFRPAPATPPTQTYPYRPA
jgi:hypothetical protein